MIQTNFAEIIDKGECLSTLHLNASISWPDQNLKRLANREEWSKYDFYPSNGLVGEIIHMINSTIYILKINNKYFVPMSKDGIRFISESEFKSKKDLSNNSGMDNRQKKINSDYDNFMKSMNQKPIYKEHFKIDLGKNFSKMFNTPNKSVTVNDILNEAAMYSCDICLNFKEKSGGILSNDWIEHLTLQTCDAVQDLIKEITHEHKLKVLNVVKELLNNGTAQIKVKQYYNYQ